MMDKKKIFEIIFTPGIILFVTAIGVLGSIPEIKKISGFMWVVYSIAIAVFVWLIAAYILWIAPAIKEKKSYLWKTEKRKELPKIKFSIDIHKSSNWNTDNRLVLCIHNESFFWEIKNLSIVVSAIHRIESGEPELVFNRSVILHEKLVVPKLKASVDFSFLEIRKTANTFVIRAIHQESPVKEIIEYKFGCGEYIIHLVLKRKDIGQDSIAIPVYIKYDGWDKITGKIHEAIPKNIFPMSI